MERKSRFEIVNAKSKVKPEIKDGRIIFHIKIEEELSLSEQTTRENLATVGVWESTGGCGKVVRQEIMAAFERSKELRLDIFGFGEMLHKKYKNEWKIMEHNWDDIYPTIELDIHVDSRIVSNDLLRRPASPDEGGE